MLENRINENVKSTEIIAIGYLRFKEAKLEKLIDGRPEIGLEIIKRVKRHYAGFQSKIWKR